MSIKCFFNHLAKHKFALTFFLVLFMSTAVVAQEKSTISGTVIDETGLTVPGTMLWKKEPLILQVQI